VTDGKNLLKSLLVLVLPAFRVEQTVCVLLWGGGVQLSANSQRLRLRNQVCTEEQAAFPSFYLEHTRDGTAGQ